MKELTTEADVADTTAFADAIAELSRKVKDETDFDAAIKELPVKAGVAGNTTFVAAVKKLVGMKKLAGKPRTGVFDDVTDEIAFAAAMKELTAEADLAEEVVPSQNREPSAIPLTTNKSLDERALAVLLEHKDWTKTEIAKHLNCTVQNLCPERCKQLDIAIKARQDARVPRGSKMEGRVEAWKDE